LCLCVPTGDNLTCSKCGVLFPTVQLLRKHSRSCQHGLTTTDCTSTDVGLNSQSVKHAAKGVVQYQPGAVVEGLKETGLSGSEGVGVETMMKCVEDDSVKKWECTVCQYRCDRRALLVMHVRVHTGERPFVCTVCDARFTQNVNLTKHMRTHTGEQPFECSVCGVRFTQSGHLSTHMHTHTGERPYECSECGAKFAQNGVLVTHMRTHTGDKPYSCTVCGKCFSHNGTRNKHQRTQHKAD
jgi:uncharacterized Zn-finger protein